jgi:hypothetical protein
MPMEKPKELPTSSPQGTSANCGNSHLLQFVICSSFDMSPEALYPTFKPVKGRSRRKATVNNMILESLRQLPAQRIIHHEENRNDRNVCNKVGLC